MNYYNKDLNIKVNINSAKVSNLFINLASQYKHIPNTKCLFCPGKCGVEADCCKTFHPPMYITEFLNCLKTISKWNEEDRKKLLYSCYESFINPNIVKPCVLLKDNVCQVYSARPTSCRLFGLYPDNEWELRLKGVAEELGKKPEEVPFFKQCRNLEVDNLIKTVKTSRGDLIMRIIAQMDVQLFTDKNFGIQAVQSGLTYLPFDAHYLLMFIGPEKLEQLTEIRMDLKKKREDFEKQEISEEKLQQAENNVKDFLSLIKNLILTKEDAKEENGEN